MPDEGVTTWLHIIKSEKVINSEFFGFLYILKEFPSKFDFVLFCVTEATTRCKRQKHDEFTLSSGVKNKNTEDFLWMKEHVLLMDC